MATLDQMKTALVNADAAGDIQSATALANAIKNYKVDEKPIARSISMDEVDLYESGQMDSNRKLQLEDDVRMGRATLPEGVKTSQYARPMDTPNNMTGIKLIKDETIGDKIVGGLEAGATLATGATTGAIGQIGGTIGGVVEEVSSGEFGTPEAAQRIKQSAEEGGQMLTYEPESKTGKKYVENIAEVALQSEALTPLTGSLGSVGKVTQAAKETVKKIPKTLKESVGFKKKPMKTEAQVEADIKKITDLAKKSIDGDKKSIDELSKEAKLNPEAVKAAEDLGIDLPADVLSDNVQIKQTIGLIRSKIGEDSANYTKMVESTVKKADEIIKKIGASSLDEVNIKVKDSYDTIIKALDKQATKIYNRVKIPKKTSATMDNSLNEIVKLVTELGGEKNLKGKAKSLYNLINRGDITYGGLESLRKEIGSSLGAMPKGYYKDVSSPMLNRLYASLKKDQLDNAGRIKGEGAKVQMQLADKLFQKKIAMQEKAAKLFGVEGDKSIAKMLESAISQGTKGDVTSLNKTINSVPKNLRKEALITGIESMISSKGASKQFSFNNFEKFFNGLKKNPTIYKKIVDELGSDSHKILKDLYIVSKRMNETEKNVLKTGKAMQGVLEGIEKGSKSQVAVEYLLGSLVKKLTLGQVNLNIKGLFEAPKVKVDAFRDLINSDEFLQLAKSKIDDTSVRKLANSKKFRTLAKAIGGDIATNPEGWIFQSLATQENKDKEK